MASRQQIVSAAPTKLIAKVPANAPVGDIAVTTPAGTVTSSTTFKPIPHLGSVLPSPAQPGDALTLTGTNLLGATALKLGSLPVPIASVDSATQITTGPLPNGAVTGVLTVTTPGGASAPIPVRVRPRIDSLSVSGGPAGATVILNGAGFTGAKSVAYTGLTTPVAAGFSVLAGGTQLKTTVPSSAVSGPVTVTNAGGTTTSADPFDVVPADLDLLARCDRGRRRGHDQRLGLRPFDRRAPHRSRRVGPDRVVGQQAVP